MPGLPGDDRVERPGSQSSNFATSTSSPLGRAYWVDPVAGAAKAAESLRPGGRLAVFWNVFQPPPDLGSAFSRVYRRVLPDSPFSRGTMPGFDGYSRFLANAADGIRAVGAFGDSEQCRFDWERSYTRQEWLDLVPTSGATAGSRRPSSRSCWRASELRSTRWGAA